MSFDLTRVAAYAETLMTDTCRIMRPGAPSATDTAAWDEDQGTYIPERVPSVLVYDGPCMIYNKKGANAPGEQGGQMTSEVRFYASLPFETPTFMPEDEVQITSSADATLVGRVFYVTGMDQGTLMATREIEMTSRVPRVN